MSNEKEGEALLIILISVVFCIITGCCYAVANDSPDGVPKPSQQLFQFVCLITLFACAHFGTSALKCFQESPEDRKIRLQREKTEQEEARLRKEREDEEARLRKEREDEEYVARREKEIQRREAEKLEKLARKEKMEKERQERLQKEHEWQEKCVEDARARREKQLEPFEFTVQDQTLKLYGGKLGTIYVPISLITGVYRDRRTPPGNPITRLVIQTATRDFHTPYISDFGDEVLCKCLAFVQEKCID